MRIALALLSGLIPATSTADTYPIPPVPEGGLMVIVESDCTDIDTGVEGYCVLSQDRRGNNYVIFSVDGAVQEIRAIQGDTYIVVWTATPGELM